MRNEKDTYISNTDSDQYSPGFPIFHILVGGLTYVL